MNMSIRKIQYLKKEIEDNIIDEREGVSKRAIFCTPACGTESIPNDTHAHHYKFVQAFNYGASEANLQPSSGEIPNRNLILHNAQHLQAFCHRRIYCIILIRIPKMLMNDVILSLKIC
jgi:hypothetical protein